MLCRGKQESGAYRNLLVKLGCEGQHSSRRMNIVREHGNVHHVARTYRYSVGNGNGGQSHCGRDGLNDNDLTISGGDTV